MASGRFINLSANLRSGKKEDPGPWIQEEDAGIGGREEDSEDVMEAAAGYQHRNRSRLRQQEMEKRST